MFRRKSKHLGKLLAGGLLLVETQGRHHYYRLACSHVALALENLASTGPVEAVRRKPPGRESAKASVRPLLLRPPSR